jgi:Type II secretion system (T2SS), protein M subtype b
MTANDRRAVRFGVIAIVGAVLVLRTLPWGIRSVGALRRSAMEQSVLLADASLLLKERRAVEDSLGAALAAVVALAPKLSEGRTPSEAQAALSALVSVAAGRHSLKVLRLDPLPDSTVGVFNRVSVHADLEGDLAGVTRLLRAVEAANPVLSVSSMRLSATDQLRALVCRKSCMSS